MQTTDTGDTPILDTRIPEHRSVPGLQYGAHVSRPGWTGYYVNATGSRWVIARQTPADNELVGDDWAILGAIIREVEALASDAERFAAVLDHDGQRWTADDGRDFETLAADMGARIEYMGRDYVDDPDTGEQVERYSRCPRLAYMAGDPIRYVFPDGSVIVAAGDGWDHEGNAPGSWRGE